MGQYSQCQQGQGSLLGLLLGKSICQTAPLSQQFSFFGKINLSDSSPKPTIFLFLETLMLVSNRIRINYGPILASFGFVFYSGASYEGMH
jgi:hypothetical protein